VPLERWPSRHRLAADVPSNAVSNTLTLHGRPTPVLSATNRRNDDKSVARPHSLRTHPAIIRRPASLFIYDILIFELHCIMDGLLKERIITSSHPSFISFFVISSLLSYFVRFGIFRLLVLSLIVMHLNMVIIQNMLTFNCFYCFVCIIFFLSVFLPVVHNRIILDAHKLSTSTAC